MASNPRKRPADLTWGTSTVSKTLKLSDVDSVPASSEERLESVLEAFSIRRRRKPWILLPPSQRDFNSYASSALSSTTVVSTCESRPSSWGHSTLPSQNPALAAPAPKNPSIPTGPIQSITYKPAIVHPAHPLSKIGQDCHWVPYPLGLMPYDSWYRLHHGSGNQPAPALRCPVCGGKREVTVHIRKLFLVAERLTWEDGLVSMYDKELNAYLNSELNNELSIRWPAVNDPEHVPGGKYSKINKFHPYYNEHEMMLAFKLLFTTDSLTEATWSLWVGMQLDIEKVLGAGEATDSSSSGVTAGGRMGATDTTSHDRASKQPRHPSGLPTLPLFSKEDTLRSKDCSKTPTLTVLPLHAPSPITRQSPSTTSSTTPPSGNKRIISYRSLQDFYILLDQIERTSYVGALFLEAYAERLRDDLCKDCWFTHNVRLDVF